MYYNELFSKENYYAIFISYARGCAHHAVHCQI